MITQKMAVILAGAMLASHGAQAQILFSQTPDLLNSHESSSSFYTYGTLSSFDNFTSAAGGSFNTVDWSGSYANTGNSPAVSGFTISIYSDNGGIAGALLASDTIAGTAGETSTVNFEHDNGDSINHIVYNYAATLPAAFSVAAGTEYWLSIVADTDNSFNNPWYWSSAPNLGGNNNAYVTQGMYGDVGTTEGLAFTLQTAPVPDGSSTMMFLGMGLAGLGFVKRKLC